MTRKKPTAPPQAPLRLAHLGDADYHAHSLNYMEGNPKKHLIEYMLYLLISGAKDQSLTEHSYDFIRRNVGFREYLSWFHKVSKITNQAIGKTSLLGMELNGVILNRKPRLELETICDPKGLKAKDIIPYLDFAIVSVHEVYYDRTAKRTESKIRSNEEFFNCSCLVIQDCERLRQYKPTLPIILGHPGKDAIKLGILPFTNEQAKSLASLLYTHNVFPEINTSELKEYQKMKERAKSPFFKDPQFNIHHYDPLFLIRQYVTMGIQNNKIPLISIGSDSHTSEEIGKIDLSTFSNYRNILSKAHLWSRKPVCRDHRILHEGLDST